MTLLSPATSRIESSPLYNPDLAPASAERRHWGTYNYAALWISMSVNILTGSKIAFVMPDFLEVRLDSQGF